MNKLSTGIQAQRVGRTEKVSGWLPDEGRIIHLMTGYATDGKKQALADPATLPAGTPFRLVSTDGSVAYEGTAATERTTIGSFAVLDFTPLTSSGIYRIEADGVKSAPFVIGDSDEPYWPQINNACYKEVWLTSAGKWLSLIAETELFNQKI